MKTELLVLAMENKPLPPDAKLNLLIYNGAQAEVFEQLDQLQLVRLAEDRSPFGTVVTVQPGLDWMTLAQLPGVQLMERAYPRARANDLTRVRIGVAENSQTTTNYLGLTGTNVLLNINDWGVDALHPDFTSRLFAVNPLALGDTNGHGTHVAGIMAGSGLSSTNVMNARGSINPATNLQYRGIAPMANIFAQLATDADGDLQENVARTNAFISNNSWGYLGDSTYSLAAASYDAAVRDSLPGVPGSQPVLYVFSAGNEGGGTDAGLGGSPGSLSSPATAKNVVSVGAGELLRDITNQVEKVTSGVTNTTTPWQAMTSSDNQVAAFSSRGNVGIRIEGDSGRFKPDVIAPGTFIVSTRSTTWDQRAYYNPTNHNRSLLRNQFVNENGFKTYPIFIPENAVGFTIALLPNEDSPPTLDLPLYLRRDGAPTLTTFDLRTTNFVAVPPALGGVGTTVGQNWFFGVANPTEDDVIFDILTDIIVTNDLGNYYTVLSNLNNSLSGTNVTATTNFYRYESGTSMAAPAVSGTLGLMQEFFEKQQRTNSPALMKALLINGARTIANIYDFRVQNTINYQGWGMINLANSLPNTVSNAFDLTANSAGAIKLVDQSPTNALATGQSHTRYIGLSELGQTAPLRITLVWTDPAANPAAGVKLVNDLDLVVTNIDTGDIYFGNDFPNVDPYNNFWDTNEPPVVDSVNNVENVYLSPFLGTNYSITVSARRVNVNAVTAHTNDVVQDYALVISSGSGEFTNAFAISNQVFNAEPQLSQVIFVTNTINQPSDFVASFLENQRVGANPALLPLLNSTNGMTNQWKFFVVTNTTTFTNAAFLISLQTDLATPRAGVFAEDEEATRRYADLDLYVTVNNPDLTNLSPAVVAGSFQSRSRNDLSGDEFIIFTNAAINNIYYVGVKSEDQMAAQFDFFAIFSLNPLGAEDGNGFVRAYPLSGYAIPEGPPSNPGGTRFVAITTPSTSGEAQSVRQVIITNYLSHDHFGDLINAVDHNSRAVIMDNHRSLTTPPYPVPPGPYAFLYDDSGEGTFPNSIPTDGPGSLNSFQGESPGGTWYFTYSDDALSQVGSVSNVMIRVDRQCETDCTLTNTVAANSWSYFSRNIPVEATNFTVCINIISGSPQPLQLYIRKDRRPTDTLYDYTMTINPSGCLSIDKFDLPPLTAGRYFIGVFNGNPTAQTFTYQSIVELGEPPTPGQFGSVGSSPLLDDAITNHTVFVTETNPISRLDVGLRIDHPRVSDLAVTLVSPRGTRVLLVENRGGTNEGGFGNSLSITNFVPVDANGTAAGQTNFIPTRATAGTVNIDYDFFQQPDEMTVYYQGLQLTNTGLISGAGRLTVAYGPGASAIVEVRMNEFGNTNATTLWNYTVSSINNIHNYLIFTDNTNRTTTPIKFATPPFTNATTPLSTNCLPTNVVVMASGFEIPSFTNDCNAGLNLTGFFEGWLVDSGNVDVLLPPCGFTALASDTGFQCLDLNGNTTGQISTNFVTVLGRTYVLSFAYSRNPGVPLFVASMDLALTGQPTRTISYGLTNSLSDLNWSHTSFVFTASSPLTTLQLTSLDPNNAGMFLDSFEVTTLDEVCFTNYGNYVLPEESLKAYEGEIPFGLWTLEILDNRTGASNNVALVDWKLQIVAQDNKPLPGILLPGEPQTNSVPPGGIVYYVVDVPPWAQYATNQLLFASGPVNVLFNQSTPPVGVVVPDYLLIGPNAIVGSTTLDAATTPPLLPGLRYYLGVQNPGTSNVTFALQVDYNITGLTNGIPVNSTLAASSQPRYFFYDISTNATATSFRLFGLSGNVDLVARRGGPLPTLLNNDYGSFNPGANNEDIVLLPASTPVPLTPGRWYLGVFNRDALPVTYNIVATEFTNTLPNIVTLTNAIPYGNTNSGAGAGVDYYRFVVSSDSVRAQFEINTPSDDVTLVARKGLPLPDLGLYDYISANVYTNDELIVLTTNSAPVILSPGDWFLTAVNIAGVPVSYSIKATEWSAAEVAPFVITSYTIASNEFCITWNSVPGAYYFVQGKTNLNAPNWDRVSPQITAVDYSTTWCIPLPSPYQFFRVGEGLVLSTFVPPPRIQSLIVGTNGVTLRWNGPITASYRVDWTPTLVPASWNSFTNVITSPTGLFQFVDDGTQTGGLGVTRYYRLILLP
ncbi:MAG: S8 family serine peptidase [Verrucomicrobiota bacterium]